MIIITERQRLMHKYIYTYIYIYIYIYVCIHTNTCLYIYIILLLQKDCHNLKKSNFAFSQFHSCAKLLPRKTRQDFSYLHKNTNRKFDTFYAEKSHKRLKSRSHLLIPVTMSFQELRYIYAYNRLELDYGDWELSFVDQCVAFVSFPLPQRIFLIRTNLRSISLSLYDSIDETCSSLIYRKD